MKTIYNTTITQIGPMAAQLLDEQMLILFKEGAPEDLAEFCFLHQINDLKEPIQPEDILMIDGQTFKVTAVGSAVNQNLDNLGHITLKFTGENSADLPGTLVLEIGKINEIQVGSSLEIVRKS
ncbi:PTS glucitol/sorbitol transporter subunit IIA [Melghirimyces algeriensis]|uniref:PTS system, glucitol/sorbitol-specific IIA component n=1 Tax=Melghirimyces algeriensis TaxID=910412 RepID=A0A521DIH7_9BACL|nr:PTS glucitol/sorbitol transporter subunit IIA [Melghirimyces algeriensis]SMO71385.1 PTS system, glucitol/sorbitol-specific IIA component [Melghirimyces algeriensis]